MLASGAPGSLFGGTSLFDWNANDFVMTLIDGVVTCGSGTGAATFAVNAPGASQEIGTPFQVTVDLTAFTPGTSATWAGYDFELAYDTTVLQASSAVPGLCPAWAWGNLSLTPRVISGCAFQESTATGTLETIRFTCLKDGSSPLRLVADNAPDLTAFGTHLFDVNATFFGTTLVDGSVTCAGAGLTPTPSPTFAPTGGLLPFVCLPDPISLRCTTFALTPTASTIRVR